MRKRETVSQGSLRSHGPHGRAVRRSIVWGFASVVVCLVAITMAITGVFTPTQTHPTTLATGDSRAVTEPELPASTCAVITADLSMPDRIADAASETNPPDTARIQQQLDDCTQTGTDTVAIELAAADTGQNAFLTGPLTIHRGEALVLDSTVTLYGSTNAADYQVSGKPTCGTLSSSEGGCANLISVDGANAGIESASAADGSRGRIDGRGDHDISGTNTTWWQLASDAQKQGTNQNAPRMVEADDSDNFTLYNIDIVDSPNFHVVYKNGDGFTAWGVHIETPATARNTDGIDPEGATNVTIANCYIMDGDDGIAIKANGKSSSNITVTGNHFYGTHGISIGSETDGGVSNVLFEGNTLSGVDAWGNASASSAGIRIKSSAENGGLVTDITYRDTCLDAVKAPLVFDTHYAKGSGSEIPWFTDIVVDGIVARNSPANAQSTIVGYDASHPLELTLTNVDLDQTSATAADARVTATASTLDLSGEGVEVTAGAGTSGTTPTCDFPGYPLM